MDVQRLNHEELVELLTEGLWQNRRQAFEFFRKHLRELCQGESEKRNPRFDEKQLNYVAWILTSFSVKSLEFGSWPLKMPPNEESQAIELLRKTHNITEISLPPAKCERLGRIVLFVASFEEDRLQAYYTDYWVVHTGEVLFLKAAVEPRIDLLLGISKNFGIWLNYLRALKHNLIRGNPPFRPPIIQPKTPA